MTFSPEELEIYSRHFNLPEVGLLGQEKLKKARVLVVGAGGLGSPVGLYLAAAGVGSLTIMDHDIVSRTNLQRQILYRDQDVGKPKTEIAVQTLRALNPHVEITGLKARFDGEKSRSIVAGHDIVVDGTDNFETRYAVNKACILENRPLVFGALHRFDGLVGVFGFQNGPCYQCIYPLQPRPEEIPGCAEAGVLGVIPGVIGSLMAVETVKMILGIGDVLSGKILTYEGLAGRFFSFEAPRNPGCAVCAASARIAPSSLLENWSSQWDFQASNFSAGAYGSKIQFVDVRSENEFQNNPLFKSANILSLGIPFINVPLGRLLETFQNADHGTAYVTFCSSGVRSRRAVEILRSLGFEAFRLHPVPADPGLSMAAEKGQCPNITR